MRSVLAIVVLGVVALSACSSVPTDTAQATNRPTPSPPSSLSQAPRPSPSNANASGAVEIAVTASFPDCTLPYVKPAGLGSVSAPFTGGFVSGPQGLWTADPAGRVNQVGSLLETSAQPTLSGSGSSSFDSVSYDAAVKRWLPVARAQVRGDGLAYVYAKPNNYPASSARYNEKRIHLVTPADGTDRVIYSGQSLFVLAWEPEGIYLAAVGHSDGPAQAMWRLDPATGSITQLPSSAGFRAIRQGVAWTDNWVIVPRRLDRIDVATGQTQTWVTANERGWIWFVGLDANGDPLVDLGPAADGSWRLFVYTAPGQGTLIASVTVHQEPISDRYGTWLAGENAIYLLKPGPRLEKVSDVTGGTIAGPCI